MERQLTYREFYNVQVKEFLRYWRMGCSQRRIAASLGVSRGTVARYVKAAREMGINPGGPEPTDEELKELQVLNRSGPGSIRAPAQELLKPHLGQIKNWLKRDQLTLVRIGELLEGRGVNVAYTSLRRFVRAQGLIAAPATVRLAQRPPGQAAEMDYGRLGRIADPDTGRQRTVWALVVVLPFSRHMFVWPTHTQTLDDAVEGLERAWEFFGGMPRHLVIDNFPAAVAGVDRYRPRLTEGFMAYTGHRGLIVDPARPARGQDKPVVERSIPYVRNRFFRGAQFLSLRDLRRQAQTWCFAVAGQRVHGTTRRRPFDVFVAEERPCLRKWEWPRYEITKSRTVKVQPDYHIQCEYALYSVPRELVNPGDRVRVEYDSRLVRIWGGRSGLIKVHHRQPKGGRSSDPDDLPSELQPYVQRDPALIRQQALELGENVADYADALLGDEPTWTMLRSGYRLIKLGQRFGDKALEKACRIALAVELVDVKRLEKILVRGLGEESFDEPGPVPPGNFSRPGSAFAIDCSGVDPEEEEKEAEDPETEPEREADEDRDPENGADR